MLTTRTRIYGWQPTKPEDEEDVVIPPSQACQLYTFSVHSNAQLPNHQLPGAVRTIHIPSNSDYASSSSEHAVPSPRLSDRLHVPRPRNCFMIFRCEYVAQHKRGKGVTPSSGKTLPVAAAEAWRSLPAEEKEKYALLAEKEKVEHARRHPGYQYHPRKKGGSTQPVSSHGGPVRGSQRVSKRGRTNYIGTEAQEEGQASEHCPEGIFTRRRSTSMPIRTESCGFLQPQSSSGRWMRRAMSVETTPSAGGMSSSVDGPFDPVNAATSPMEIPPSEPSSPLMQVREDDVHPQLKAPPLSTTSSLAGWDRLPSSSPQTDLVMHSVLPWQSQPPNETYPQETWDDPSSYTHSYEPRMTPLHAEYSSTEPAAVYPWPYHSSSQPEHTFDAQWKACNEAEEAARSYALQNFDYGMAQQSLANGEDLAFDMSTADEGKFLEGYLNF